MTIPDTSRASLLESLRKTRHVPVLIVGGGINGIGTFRDLSLQGVNCILVEKGDFCAGASRAPSRMIHGGLKYLETGEFRLVKESAAERNRLLANASHYVRPLEMIIPIYSWFGGTLAALRKFLRLPAKLDQRGALVIKLGLALYDIYGAFNRAMPRHRMIARSDILREIPDLDPGIKLAASYYDAWITSPERLVLELALDGMAAKPGNLALNHLRFTGINGNQVQLQDVASGETFSLTCDIMLNAAGAWIDRVNTAAGESRKMIGGTKGSHLMLNLPAFAKTLHGRMLYFEAEGGRICIVSNFMGHVLLGSTDLPHDDPDRAICEDSEVDYLLSAFRRIFPQIDVKRADIFFSYAGVRPLPANSADDPGAISRDHSLPELPPTATRSFPILSLVGGKWTTFRAFSEQVSEAVTRRLNLPRQTATTDKAIGGGVGLSQQTAPTEHLLTVLTKETPLTRDRAMQLINRYGARARLVAQALGPDQGLTFLPELSRQEIAILCQTELVQHAEDLLFGRTTLFMERPLPFSALQELVQEMGELLDWSVKRHQDELDRLLARYRSLHRIEVPRDGESGPFFQEGAQGL